MKNAMIGIFIISTLLTTTIYAQNWAWKTGVPNFWAVSAVDSNNVWAGGDANFMVRTTNGGQWVWWYNLGGWGIISSIQAIDANNAWVLSTQGDLVVHKFTNEWTDNIIYTVNSNEAPFANFIHFWDDNIGIVMGDPKTGQTIPYIIRTTDGGTTWTELLDLPHLPNDTYGLIGNYSVIGDNCWFGIAGGSDTTIIRPIYHSMDQGKTWTTINPPPNFGSVQRVSFMNTSTGIIEGYQNKFAITTDGGSSWIERPKKNVFRSEINPYNGFIYTNFWDSENREYQIARSTDLGLSWNYIKNPANRSIFDFSFADNKTVWVAGENETLMLGMGTEMPTGVSNGDFSNITEKFSLSQNYPNPFNPSTTITYNLSEQANITLEVYNMLGEKVKKISEGIKSIGHYAILFNAKGLSSGTYIYRLKANDRYIAKKMILLR